MKTLLLDNQLWDLLVDANGNIALASEPYALAQDVASSIRLFAGELWYDSSKGIPYFEDVLGQLPPTSLLNSLFQQAALSVPTVVEAQVILLPLKDRGLTGQIQFKDNAGVTGSVEF